MRMIEESNSDLKGILPRSYTAIPNDTIASLLRHISSYTKDLEGDAFGLIYEYFLANFALAEGQGAGEFFTPMSIVRLIVEILEPFHGRIFDPACGSGGMFVHSARFVERHRGSPGDELSIFGQEKTSDTVKLAKMNLAVHGLSISGDVRVTNSYYEDPFKSFGHFDFVMANPPFNVDRIDKAKLVDDKRFPDLPKADNGNYIWIQLFANSLNETGRAGFVMANSASDARHSEAEIRRKLIEDGLVDVMVAVSSNFFYSVTLPVTLWFLDRGKSETPRQNKVLFLDARQVFRQVDRAHRDFTGEQTEFLANIVRLYRDEKPELVSGGNALFEERFRTASTPTSRVSARSRRSKRSRHRGGASIRVATSEPRLRRSTMRCSRSSSRNPTQSSVCLVPGPASSKTRWTEFSSSCCRNRRERPR
jgi:type I restriction enzyme M protein